MDGSSFNWTELQSPVTAQGTDAEPVRFGGGERQNHAIAETWGRKRESGILSGKRLTVRDRCSPRGVARDTGMTRGLPEPGGGAVCGNQSFSRQSPSSFDLVMLTS